MIARYTNVLCKVTYSAKVFDCKKEATAEIRMKNNNNETCYQTRMHSSRMHTALFSGRLEEVVCLGGLPSESVCPDGDDVSAQDGVSSGVYTPLHAGIHPLLCEQNDSQV